MFPFWHDVVAPIIEAAGARRIVEVGALRGENTELMLERLGPEVELHVIDPLPDFDPAEHEERFGGRYFFYRDLSVNVLDRLPVMDVALIDGDHNWFTVYTECSQLAAVAARDSAPLPVLILHDVEWPYGRRDLYYDPTNIPEEHVQPWARAGMRRGVSELVTSGMGMNPTLANATHEGGPRNGVMTGLDDFIAEHPKPLRKVVLPLYFGLAIVVEEELLAARPELAAALDHLESNEGKDELLRLGEGIRLDAITFDQALLRLRDERIGRIGRKYLDTVKSAILNDHHIHNEVLVHHLRTVGDEGQQAQPRPPARPGAQLAWASSTSSAGRHRTGEKLRLQREAKAGERVQDDGITTQGFASSGRVGLDIVERAMDEVWGRHLRGDIASVGFGKGGATILMAAYLEAHDEEHRKGHRRTLWIGDRFLAGEGRADLNQARERLDAFGLLDDRVRFVEGEPATALRDLTTQQQTETQLTFLHLGPGLGDDVTATLDVLYPRLVGGGVIVVEDGDVPEVAAAVKAFRDAHGIAAELVHEGPGVLHWTKEVEFRAPRIELGLPARDRPHVAVAKTGRILAPDLSVVVVVHNMKREAARTLHSLSRALPAGHRRPPLRGRRRRERLGPRPGPRRGVRPAASARSSATSTGPTSATPSPAHALNRGLAATTGHAVALMVDGAHVLTPRVLHYGMTGLRNYQPAVVATQAWYVGPGQQGDAMRFGYDQAVEDALFEQITLARRTATASSRSATSQGDRDWFDGLWESNCLFVDRELLLQVRRLRRGLRRRPAAATPTSILRAA